MNLRALQTLIFICTIKDLSKNNIPGNIYLFKVNNRNGRKSCEKCLKLTIKTPERPH